MGKVEEAREFLKMVGMPFLVDGFRLEITLHNIFFIIKNGSVIGMMVVFFYYNRAQPLLCHMPLNPFYTAGSSAAIEDMAYFNRPIPPLCLQSEQKRLYRFCSLLTNVI